MSGGESVAPVLALRAQVDFEKHVLELLESMRSEMCSRLTRIEEKVDHCRKAIIDLTERGEQTRRGLESRIDGLRVETEVLAQAALLGRLDAEKAERVAEWAIRQRDEAQAALENAPTESPTNGNGRYSSAPPPKDA